MKKIYTCPSSPLTSLFAARATETATNFGGFTVEMKWSNAISAPNERTRAARKTAGTECIVCSQLFVPFLACSFRGSKKIGARYTRGHTYKGIIGPYQGYFTNKYLSI